MSTKSAAETGNPASVSKKTTSATQSKAKKAAPLPGGSVFEFLTQLNQPVNAQMVVDHFRSAISKAAAEKQLLELAASGHVVLKENGKSKIFWLNQEDMDAPSEAELRQLDSDISRVTAEKRTMNERLASLKASVSAHAKMRSLEELRAEEKHLRDSLWKSEAQLSSKQGNSGDVPPMSDKESEQVGNFYRKSLKEYKRRRSTCLEILQNLSENLGKPVKQLMEEWGLEGDEDHGVSVSSFPALPMQNFKPKT